ncbi:MAG: ribonuclease HII [Nanoarchaeota archaeon]|nr:ribonuclease HII [Nanoarchaeota archaeon]
MTIICGVEEAGRGPVIGPLVMAGVNIDKDDEHLLVEMGVKDSKLLTPERREALFDRIKQAAIKYEIIILSAEDVDNALLDPIMNLNWLEAATSAKIIDLLIPDTAILDCPSTNIPAYTEYVRNKLNHKVNLISEHKADVNYPIVGAASILAKVTRDREIKKIKDRIRIDFGSGYPSDPRTVKFLNENYEKHKEIFRKTWVSYKRVVEKEKQKGLQEF